MQMKAEYQKREMSSQEIEQHLKSAVDALAPDIFDRLDLSVPQQKPRPDDGREKIVSLQRRMRGMAVAAAAYARHGCGGSGMPLPGDSRGWRMALPVSEPSD
ncbi:MAG: hypothetical protein ACLS6B_13580 [Clostridium sp.]